jgi:hypothetical protein
MKDDFQRYNDQYIIYQETQALILEQLRLRTGKRVAYILLEDVMILDHMILTKETSRPFPCIGFTCKIRLGFVSSASYVK